MGRAWKRDNAAAWFLKVCLAFAMVLITSPSSSMQLVPFQLLPWCWIPDVLRLCGSFKWSFLKIQQFLLLPQSSLVFIARSYGDLFSQCWNPGLCGPAWGWDRSLPRYLSWFLSTTCECGTTSAHFPAATTCLHHTMSPCLSSPSTCMDEWGFFIIFIFYFFIVVLVVSICTPPWLPAPPSPPPSLKPIPFGFAPVFFIHVPWWAFP